MKIDQSVQFDYDDNILEIIDKVNDALEQHGLLFDSDRLDHDGFEVFTLRRIGSGE